MQEIQSANTLMLTSPTHNNNNNNNDDDDHTDNPSTVVIGQIIDPSTLPQMPPQVPHTDENGDNIQGTRHNLITATSQEERSLTTDTSQRREGKGTPMMRKISVCLEGTVVCESTYVVGSNSNPEPSRLVPENSRGRSTENQSDNDSIASERSRQHQDSKLLPQPSTFLEVPMSSSPKRSSDLEEEKTAAVRYRKHSLQSQLSQEIGAVTPDY